MKEAARILRISPQATYNLVHRGELPARKIGGAYRIMEADLEEYLEHGARYVPEPSEMANGEEAEAEDGTKDKVRERQGRVVGSLPEL